MFVFLIIIATISSVSIIATNMTESATKFIIIALVTFLSSICYFYIITITTIFIITIIIIIIASNITPTFTWIVTIQTLNHSKYHRCLKLLSHTTGVNTIITDIFIRSGLPGAFVTICCAQLLPSMIAKGKCDITMPLIGFHFFSCLFASARFIRKYLSLARQHGPLSFSFITNSHKTPWPHLNRVPPWLSTINRSDPINTWKIISILFLLFPNHTFNFKSFLSVRIWTNANFTYSCYIHKDSCFT